MTPRTTFPSVGADTYRDVPARRDALPKAGYVLAVSGALAVVTFTLVYLTTLTYAPGF